MSPLTSSVLRPARSRPRAAAREGETERARRLECRWQREQLPDVIRELVLDDQRLRNEICWSVFDCWWPGACRPPMTPRRMGRCWGWTTS